jgi:DNA-binding transcriptional regulator YiaG
MKTYKSLWLKTLLKRLTKLLNCKNVDVTPVSVKFQHRKTKLSNAVFANQQLTSIAMAEN